MKPVHYIERTTGKVEEEKVYGAGALRLLYGNGILSCLIGAPLRFLVSRVSLCSRVYGAFQKLPFSRRKVIPFIQSFGIDPAEFQDPPESFRSFNEFFIRKLKTKARPIATGDDVAVIPADGRYYFYQNIADADGFIVKGKRFSLAAFLQDSNLAADYAQGSMLLARLCPIDYHRFHFPCANIPGATRQINGWLYSVNPAAIQRNLEIFTENKRTVCELETERFGKVLYCEIGATNVGSIHQTYIPYAFSPKGSEKGYFSFGGSALLLLFPPGRIRFDADLIAATQQGLEIRCLMGQRMGKSV